MTMRAITLRKICERLAAKVTGQARQLESHYEGARGRNWDWASGQAGAANARSALTGTPTSLPVFSMFWSSGTERSYCLPGLTNQGLRKRGTSRVNWTGDRPWQDKSAKLELGGKDPLSIPMLEGSTGPDGGRYPQALVSQTGAFTLRPRVHLDRILRKRAWPNIDGDRGPCC